MEEILKIYDLARAYMKNAGNPNQWDNGYPDCETIRNDMQNKHLFVVTDEKQILGVFAFILGEEPTYQVIKWGQWNLEKEYGTIHRIALAGMIKGFAKICFDFCLEQIDYLRIDTHKDNKPMQHALEKYGFKKCGIMHVRNGERIAFDFSI